MRKHYAEAIMIAGVAPTPLGYTLAALLHLQTRPAEAIAAAYNHTASTTAVALAVTLPTPPALSASAPTLAVWRQEVVTTVQPILNRRIRTLAHEPDVVDALRREVIDVSQLPTMVRAGLITFGAARVLLTSLDREIRFVLDAKPPRLVQTTCAVALSALASSAWIYHGVATATPSFIVNSLYLLVGLGSGVLLGMHGDCRAVCSFVERLGIDTSSVQNFARSAERYSTPASINRWAVLQAYRKALAEWKNLLRQVTSSQQALRV